MKYLANIDLSGNQLLNVVVQVLAAAPSSPAAGRMYYDSSLQKLRYYNGSGWVDLDATATDAATKAYVDANSQGLDVKSSVRAATTADITLAGTQTIDGVDLIEGDRVLVKDQTAAATNGIYVVAAGAWNRPADADTGVKVTGGMFTFVEEGTTNADSGWVLATNGAIVLGTTALTFVQFSGAGQITAGT